MSAPPAIVAEVSGCRSAVAPRIAVQNGSTVATIAVRTGPNVARPRRNVTNASTVHTSASASAVAHACGDRCTVSVPSTAASARNTTAAPAVTSVDAAAGDVRASSRCRNGT